MGVRMIRWRQWPTRKYEARVVLRRMEGQFSGVGFGEGGEAEGRVVAEVLWKGSGQRVGVLRRVSGVKRNFTREAVVGEGGVVEWDEEFGMVCNLTVREKDGQQQQQSSQSGSRGGVQFQPWEVGFTAFNVNNQAQRNKTSTIGTATLDLADYASAAEQKEFELTLPLVPSADAMNAPSLSISLSLVELRTNQEVMEVVQRPVAPVSSPSQLDEVALAEKDDLSAIKAGLRKVKIFTELVSARKAKKTPCVDDGSDGRYSARSEDGDPFDSDFLEDTEEGCPDEANGDPNGRIPFKYGTLADAKIAGGSFYSSMRISGEIEDWLYYSHNESEVGSSGMEDISESIYEPQASRSFRSILPWRKRKLGFRSPKARGEPLLKKANAEEGGDDIDFARRQLTSDDSMSYGWYKTDEDPFRSLESEFSDDIFAVGNWEKKEIISRDGHLKLNTEVFFASIDQRSERAAGESACTALVAVIADWFHSNPTLMPIKSQFDGLIRDGSLEWRNLCEIETYRQRFPDKHFDLDTVLEAKVRPISVAPEKSFVGFFHPEGMNEDNFGFLIGAMSFDEIWEEICCAGGHCSENREPLVYIISWNDHFFILLVKEGAYFIIDTLGERLYEGCMQAYILKFESNSVICRLPQPAESSGEKERSGGSSNGAFVGAKQKMAKVEEKKAGEEIIADAEDAPAVTVQSEATDEAEAEVICRGKESCKEYIKSFLAAIPIRELQDDVRKGRVSSVPLHHRLQIEFHYTQMALSQPASTETTEMETEPPEPTAEVEMTS
ncbi:hypothetical protein MLD38_033136 [Melastoma candidum]|uniref:Uncharacterized protein n=1 Tax=Melastoma candidum TaxID=119954 RepID=A0ACB9M6C5_9MYRT|nr:hypothetical protein MLD38_033136 [Melastoma candidum]